MAHWPAPDVAFSKSLLQGVAFSAALASAIGVAFFAVTADRIAKQRRVVLSLSLLRATWWLGLSGALAPALYGAHAARVVSERWAPFRICALAPLGTLTTRLATLIGVLLPLALFARATRPSSIRVTAVGNADGLVSYRAAAPSTFQIMDLEAARATLISKLTSRLALALAVSLTIVVGLIPALEWGAPDTMGLFEISCCAIAILAFHYPTQATLDYPLKRALATAARAIRL